MRRRTGTGEGGFLINADPSKAADELDRWAAGLEQKARRYTELQRQLDQTTATASSSDGAVRVTVDANGVPTGIEFSERVRDLDPRRLSAEVMSCLGRAQAELRAQVEELVQDTELADDEPARNIVSQYRQRFPDPAEESATDEPPPRPRPSTPDRPGDDDWDDESPLRG